LISLSELPGAEIVQSGIADANAGHLSIAALLVAIGAPRLVAAGLEIPKNLTTVDNPNVKLYNEINKTSHDTYQEYNSLIRRLVSFEENLERSNNRK